MGSAAVKMGVIPGPPIESPDVMYDLKERVHRTPHVRGSAVPSPTRLNINQEEDIMLLSNGTVVRIQVKHKDGSRGINLYKRDLKSVPRELFYHPLAEEVTWLNLACNALVYNKNGLFRNIDKVEKSYFKEDSDLEEDEEEEEKSIDESNTVKTSSRQSSVTIKPVKEATESQISTQSKVDKVSVDVAGDNPVLAEGIDTELAAEDTVENLEKEEGSSGEQILLKNTLSVETNASSLPETASGDQQIDETKAVALEKGIREEVTKDVANENDLSENVNKRDDSKEVVADVENTTGSLEVDEAVPAETVQVDDAKEAVAEVEDTAESLAVHDAAPAESAVAEEAVKNNDVKSPRDEVGTELLENLPEATPVEVIDPEPVLETSSQPLPVEQVPEAAPAENSLEIDNYSGLDDGTEQNLTIKPGDLIPEDVVSEVSSVDMGQDAVLEDSQLEVANDKEAVSIVVDEQPIREDDANIEDFDGVSMIRSQALKSVAETVDISEFEETDYASIGENENAVKDGKVSQAAEKTASSTKENGVEVHSKEAKSESDESESDSDKEEEQLEEEEDKKEDEEPAELMSDEEGDLHDEEGNVIPRPANTLPNRFHKMPNLVELHLGYYGKGNPLKTIPNSIYSLQLLKKLDASSCRLTEIPPEISQLVSLEELWLSGNFLSSLPKSIGDLKNLKSLWVNYNQLNGIPATLEFCESLEGIYAHGNRIEFLSTALCRIPKLKHLGVGRNRIKFLPKNMGELVNLEEAWLNDNHIREVPESMFKLKALKTLWMSNNQLTSLDKRVGNLSDLAELSLSKNRLTTLPSSLADCTQLRVLQLDDNKLVALPKSLNGLGHLEELWLNGNAVKEIPEGLYMISNMRKPA